MRTTLRLSYDCRKCPAWCCCYPNIFVNDQDLKRLAKHFGISESDAERRYTKISKDYNRRIMKHKKDQFFGTSCRFLDSETRRCTVYLARPLGCRTYPGGRCGYYDFLKEERHRQNDDTLVATTDHKVLDWEPGT